MSGGVFRVRPRGSVSLMLAVFGIAMTTAMCGNRTGLPICGGTTGVDCIDVKQISKTTCTCTCSGPIVSFVEGQIGAASKALTFPVARCLPDAINSEVTPLATIKTIKPADYTSMLVTSCDDVQ